MVGMTNNCMAEMMTYHPVPGGFISLAGKYVDQAFGFMAGWNCKHLLCPLPRCFTDVDRIMIQSFSIRLS